MIEEPIPLDPEGVEERQLWQVGYELAAMYWPGLPEDDFYAYARDFSLAYAEWSEIVGDDPHQPDVERFYRDGYGMIFSMLRKLPQVPASDIVLSSLKVLQQKTVLDFGAGIGSLALKLHVAGYNVGCVDVGETATFGSWRMENAGAPIHYYDSLRQAGRGWKAIIALDVLEHTWNPIELLEGFYDTLPSGGLLVFTVDRFGPHPTHLARNYWLKEKAPQVLDQVGFRLHRKPDPHYGIGVWRKP